MLPIVLNAPNVPTVLPLSSRLSTENFTRDGVTVPSKNSGNTKITMHAQKAAMIRKLLLTVKTSSADIPRIMYLPTTGINAIQIAAIMILPYNLSGSWNLSAVLPPYILPNAIAIIIVPIIIVHTICDELKYGANSLLAPSSTAMTDIPAKNSVRYKNRLFFITPLFSLAILFLLIYELRIIFYNNIEVRFSVNTLLCFFTIFRWRQFIIFFKSLAKVIHIVKSGVF